MNLDRRSAQRRLADHPLSLIRGGAIALAAVATPGAVLFAALGSTGSTTLAGLVVFLAVIALALAVVAGWAWACVRIARFTPRIAVVLTTWPFLALTIAAVPALAGGNVLPPLFWAVQLALAVFLAHSAARRAQP